MKTKGKNITVHFSDETYTKLSMLAKQQERSKGFFIKKAIDSFLRDRKEDDEDYRIGLESL
jgi:predicted transcriptional regulator